MRVFVVDSEDLPGSIYGSLIVLRDDKGARENEATDRERMPVLSLCRTRLQVLGFYFRVPIGSKLCLELDLIYLISPSPVNRPFNCGLLSSLFLTSLLPTRHGDSACPVGAGRGCGDGASAGWRCDRQPYGNLTRRHRRFPTPSR